MKFTELLPTLCFIVVFPLWLRLIGRFIYRDSGWKRLAEHYQANESTGKFSRIPRLVIGNTSVNGCKVRKEADFLILKMGFPFRLFAPHPPLKIPLARIRMKGRNKGTISVRGNGIPFEGFDPRKIQ